MPFFFTGNKTVYSSENPKLEQFYSFLEKYSSNFSGSKFYEELLNMYQKLDEELKEEK
ncbi:hypothetical protein [Niallia sp. NCCP-28]|uniref:hypothetical protein n=1 Tax=Niallia sp. NCCP-28 TaxID=2934712 RepID=UPI0020892BEE|nr:hypothetical protein [Niallia sp. NCCP-28]GKU81234.1 hypothetical protein NCCP28_06300 [Niallia sp. NCCP-28]